MGVDARALEDKTWPGDYVIIPLKIRKSYIVLILSLVIITTAAVLVQYYHFRGVKDTLEHLVQQKTKGRYKLDLGETKYDFLKLDFILKDARIYRIDTINNTRVYSVELPYVRINLGSLKSYFSFGQINVKEFVVDEPVIVLRKEKREKQQLRLSAELANLLQIVKELLDSFNVHSFKINRGSFVLNRDDQVIRINLIDFLAEEWNVRKLTRQSQIKINIGGQAMDIFSHDVSFNQIEYSYLKRQLTITDFSYQHTDVETGASLYASGKKFIVYHVNWEELSSTKRYKLKRIEVVSPVIRGSFPLSRNHKSVRNFAQQLYDAIGEMTIDSLTVRNARVHMAYQQKEDSTSVTFQNASFRVTDFKLLNTSDLFDVGEVLLNLNNTELIVAKKYKVSFDSLFYNHHLRRGLYVEGLQLSERNAGKPFLTSQKVRVTYFNPFDFLLHKKIRAESLELNGVSLTISPDVLKTKPSEKSSIELELGKLKIANAIVNYADEHGVASARDISFNAHRISIGKKGKSAFDFDRLQAGLVQYADRKNQWTIRAHAIAIDDTTFNTKKIEAKQTNGIFAVWDEVGVGLDSFHISTPYQLSSLHAAKLHLSGILVSSNKSQTWPDLKLNKLSIDTVLVGITSNAQTVNMRASDFILNEIRLQSTGVSWSQIQTTASQISFENMDWKVTGEKSKINSHTHSQINDVHILKKDSTINGHAAAFAISPFRDLLHLSTGSIIHPVFNIQRKQIQWNGVADSITFSKLSLAKDKSIDELHVHHPVLEMNLLSQSIGKQKNEHLQFPKPLGKVFIHHAQVKVNTATTPLWIYTMNAQWTAATSPLIQMDSVTKNVKQTKVTARKLSLTSDELSLANVSATPLLTMENYSTSGYERDRLTMNFDGVKARGILLDSLLFGNKLEWQDIGINGFQIDVFKDKRLPDGPVIERQLFSKGINSMLRAVTIPRLHFANGTVTISQMSDKTQARGQVVIDRIAGELRNIHAPLHPHNQLELEATASIFGGGEVELHYQIKEENRFRLRMTASELDLKTFNKMTYPILSVRFKSGKLKTLHVQAEANDTVASGNAIINYQDLRIKVQKADKSNFGNEVVTVVANEIIKNKRNNRSADFTLERNKDKAEFAYWLKIVMRGALGATRYGKKQKKIR